MSKRYRFIGDRLVEAADEEQAKDLFADTAWDFAAEAQCYEACPQCLGLLKGTVMITCCGCEPASRGESVV